MLYGFTQARLSGTSLTSGLFTWAVLSTASLYANQTLADARAPSYLELGYVVSDMTLTGQEYSGSGVQVQGALALNTRLRLVGHYRSVSYDSTPSLSAKDFGLGADYHLALGGGIELGARYEYIRSQIRSSANVTSNGNFVAGELLWSLPDWVIDLGEKRHLELYGGYTGYSDTNINEAGAKLRVYLSDQFSVGLAYQQTQPNTNSHFVISIREER